MEQGVPLDGIISYYHGNMQPYVCFLYSCVSIAAAATKKGYPEIMNFRQKR